MSALLYRGAEYSQQSSADVAAPVQLTYRRNSYLSNRSAAGHHTAPLTYRGNTYVRGVSYEAIAANWG
jgi:ribosomal protein S10